MIFMVISLKYISFKRKLKDLVRAMVYCIQPTKCSVYLYVSRLFSLSRDILEKSVDPDQLSSDKAS